MANIVRVINGSGPSHVHVCFFCLFLPFCFYMVLQLNKCITFHLLCGLKEVGTVPSSCIKHANKAYFIQTN